MVHSSTTQPGLIWAFDVAGDSRPLADVDLDSGPAPGVLRWVHLNLADQRSRRWIADRTDLPPSAREAILAADGHQRALIAGRTVVCAFHDLQREFADGESSRMGVINLLAAPRPGGGALVISARVHPVHGADMAKRRIDAGAAPIDEAGAFELLVGCIVEVASAAAAQLTATVQQAEDMLLDHGREPDARALAAVRRRTVQLSRQIGGLRAVLQRLEEDEDLPEAMLPPVVKLVQRSAALAADIVALQSTLRQLREELDLQQSQRTNQNLYVLSILSALLLPATLVTGIFGMNTRGLPLIDSPAGGAAAVFLAFAAAFGVYLWLRLHGFFRR